MTVSAAHLTNTEYERIALDSGGINLSDGHARIPFDEVQWSLARDVFGTPQTWATRPQNELEDEFLRAFRSLAGQSAVADANTFLAYSSSSSIQIAAHYCRLRKLRVLLLEPCFDNIYHMLRTLSVPVEPVSEKKLLSGEVVRMLQPGAALWIVQPNNPTGALLSMETFEGVVEACVREGVTLIADFCFRFHSGLIAWDQYEMLERSGIDYICLEDTGKTWSTFDQKIGITLTSAQPRRLIHELHDQLLLNVSPLTLRLLTVLIRDSTQRGLHTTLHATIERNRAQVHRLIDNRTLKHLAPQCRNVPMETLTLCGDGLKAKEFWGRMRARGVEILPGDNYHWSRVEGELGNFFRIPLARDPDQIATACSVIRDVVEELRT